MDVKDEADVTHLEPVAVPEDHQIPDGGYGWVCVACVSTINGFTWGVLASYGVYLSYYLANDVFPEATPLDYAFIGGLNFGVSLIIASPVTVFMKRYGTHLPSYIGAITMACGFVAASFAQRIWQLYLTQGILVGLGNGCIFIPSVTIVSQWFDKKRSMANGICSAGSGIGGLIFSFATEAMIQNISLGWALRITGIVSGTMLVIATSLVRNRNHIVQPPMHPFDTKLLRNPRVLLLLCWGFMSMLGYMTLLYSLPDFSRSIGLTASQAATSAALLNLGTAIGRPLVGFASDRFGRIKVAGLCTVTCGISVFAIWLPADSFGVTSFYAIICGAILGTYWMTISPLSVEVAGLKELPSMLALNWIVMILPTTFSEVIALKLRHTNSSRVYLYTQIFAGTCYLVASAIIFRLYQLQNRRKPATV